MAHDMEIIDTLDQEPFYKYSGTLWRTTWLNRDPLRGSFGGGRWAPAQRFEALYTSLDKAASIHELYYHLSKAPVFSSSLVQVCELSINDIQVLDLTSERLLKLLHLYQRPASDVISQCQKIGAAAYFLGAQGIIVPSYRKPAKHCVIFPEKINSENLHIVNKQDINWPAWIWENIKQS